MKVVACPVLRKDSSGQEHLMAWKCPIPVHILVLFSVISPESRDNVIQVAIGEK